MPATRFGAPLLTLPYNADNYVGECSDDANAMTYFRLVRYVASV